MPLTILIDSNIFIALESLGISPDAHSHDSAKFNRLASQLGARITVAAATREDILRAPKERQNARLEQLSRYFVLDPVPRDQELARRAGFSEPLRLNNEVDLDILGALEAGAADWLVTQDVSLRKRARRAGLGNRVLSLPEVLETLSALVSKPSLLPSVATIVGYQIDTDAPIFDSLKLDYPEFIQWWRDRVAKEHRDVLVLGSHSSPEGIAVLKLETDMPHGLQGKVLKICTFKTDGAYQGTKRGELLLSAAIDYARRNGCKRTYLEVLPSKESLLHWLVEFGFVLIKDAVTQRGEHVVMKELVPPTESPQLSALEYNIAYGPGALRPEAVHLVPIQPQFHRRLFPTAEAQLPLFPRSEPCGNAIRKAYLCNAHTRTLEPGDAVIFIRTGGKSMATAVGVVESTQISREPHQIMAFVGNRTVYSFDEMIKLCQNRETLAIRFRLDRIITPSWSIIDLQSAGVLRSAPRSIQKVRERGTEWLRQQLAG